MMVLDEELLITLVRDRRELYDTQHKQYEDNHRRDEAWQEIGKCMQRPAHECRERWKQLRDNYRKARKLRLSKKAQGIKKIKAIKYDKLMTFMHPIMDNNLCDRIDMYDNVSAGSSVMHVEEPILQMPVRHNIDPLTSENNYGEYAKPDTLVTFFTNLGETVKTFPEDIQIRVKRDIFKIINEAEEEVCKNKLKMKDVLNIDMKFEVND